MRRLLAIIAIAGSLGGLSAPVATAQDTAPDEEVIMLTGRVFRALRDCEIDGNLVDTLTLAQVAGIVLAASSGEGDDRCQRIQAIALGE